MRQELLAMLAAHTSRTTGEAQLKTFLTTPSGAPRVREDEGVRALFEPDAPLEPSVAEPALQHTYAARLAEPDGLWRSANGEKRRRSRGRSRWAAKSRERLEPRGVVLR